MDVGIIYFLTFFNRNLLQKNLNYLLNHQVNIQSNLLVYVCKYLQYLSSAILIIYKKLQYKNDSCIQKQFPLNILLLLRLINDVEIIALSHKYRVATIVSANVNVKLMTVNIESGGNDFIGW